MLSDYGKLAIAILVYFIFALPVAVYVCWKHGFGRQAGWFYLLSLTIVRIVGACLTLANSVSPDHDVAIAAVVFYSIGVIPLMLAALGLVNRMYVSS